MAEGSPNSKVKFVGDVGEKPNLTRYHLTQKYNRQDMQKRLEIENWMDEQMKELFESEDYPALDIDDVLKIDPSEREAKMKDYLAEAKKPTDEYIRELLVKIQQVKPANNI